MGNMQTLRDKVALKEMPELFKECGENDYELVSDKSEELGRIMGAYSNEIPWDSIKEMPELLKPVEKLILNNQKWIKYNRRSLER